MPTILHLNPKVGELYYRKFTEVLYPELRAVLPD